MEPGSPASTAPPARTGRLTKNQKIGLGLLCTIVGIILLSVLLPTAPARLAYALPAAGIGILALWIGGILMGVGSRS
ncbi:MAG: hypothetical protein WBF81_06795 [Thermoplasmata archaeon]